MKDYLRLLLIGLVVGLLVLGLVYADRRHQEWFTKRQQVCTCQRTNAASAVTVETMTLPPGVTIQRSGDGKYRWKKGFWASMQEHDSYDKAVRSFMEMEQLNSADKTNWVDLPQ